MLKSIDHLRKLVQEDKIRTVVVGFTDIYGKLCGKRYDADNFMKNVVSDGTHVCNYLLGCDIDLNPVKGYEYASFEKGYGDAHILPDMKTLRVASWLDRTAIVLCDVPDAKPAPRHVLRDQLARLDKLGFKSLAATELEFFTYETSYRDAFKSKYHNLRPFSDTVQDYQILQQTREEKYHAACRYHLKHSGLVIENSKGEAAIGQHELNIEYNDPLSMADDHVIFKQALKEIADEQNMSVTFMAKPHGDQAGSSCHVHMSLLDAKTGKPVFHSQPQLFQHFLGGWIKYTNDIMPWIAPTPNSYKRFTEGSWAPTRLAWSDDNRTAGYRVVGHGNSLRIECRIGGADANPYLILAGLLAAGIEGIERKIMPPPEFKGDIYQAQHLPRVARNLTEATSNWEKSEFVTRAFGKYVQDHYTNFYRTEQAAFDRAVTDWERVRYFERI